MQVRSDRMEWMIPGGGLNRLPGDLDRDQDSLSLQPFRG